MHAVQYNQVYTVHCEPKRDTPYSSVDGIFTESIQTVNSTQPAHASEITVLSTVISLACAGEIYHKVSPF